jgi:hypothetical protein
MEDVRKTAGRGGKQQDEEGKDAKDSDHHMFWVS